MEVLFLFAIMVYLSRSAAVYDERLLFSGYVDIPDRLARLLVSGHYPMSKTKNTPENRQKLTIMSVVLYSLIVICIICCAINGCTLEPIAELEKTGYNPRFTTMSFSNSTEALNGCIVFTCFCFVALFYTVNDFRIFIKPSYSDSKKGLVGILLICIIVLTLVLSIIGGKNTLIQWQKIKSFSP